MFFLFFHPSSVMCTVDKNFIVDCREDIKTVQTLFQNKKMSISQKHQLDDKNNKLLAFTSANQICYHDKGGDLDNICYLVKPTVPGMGYILLSRWSRRFHRCLCGPEHHRLLLKLLVYGSRSLLLKTSLTYVIKSREIELVHNQKLHPY